MMARIDEFFKAMAKYQAAEFHLASDAEPQFKIAHLMQPVSKQKFTRQEVLALISEVLPQDKKELLMSQAAVDFVYRLAGVGDFKGRVSMDGAKTTAMFVPSVDASPQSADLASPAMLASPVIPASPAMPASPAAAPLAAFSEEPRSASSGGRETEIDKFLKLLVQRKGSDLHLSSGEHPIIRVDGDIKKLEEYPVTAPADAQRLLSQIMDKRHRKEFDEISDTDFAYEIAGLARFRVNIFADRKGMGGVFRVIPSKTVTVDELGVSQAIQNLCFLNKGLVLVTGPTGSGKSTTLCAMIDLINRTRTAHIITLEDPIEFVHENKKCLINQREVGSHTQSFKNALRAALREDPNIVLVGEM
ncbi:MAG: ATPase, T2SS/T4P/T4SS family, partial [Candidatus Edwardsbacteria bacterium]|nr:ATPase, T2SS/T4P/T4SS family [Candidatus Edwardsbacteria bacterium]